MTKIPTMTYLTTLDFYKIKINQYYPHHDSKYLNRNTFYIEKNGATINISKHLQVSNLLLETPPSTLKKILLEKNSSISISSRIIMILNPNNFWKAIRFSNASSILGVLTKKKCFFSFRLEISSDWILVE